MNINNLPKSSVGALALSDLVFTDFNDAPDNPRPGLGYHQLYDPTKPVSLIARLPDITRVGDTITLYWDGANVQQYDLDQATIDKGWLSFSVLPSIIKAPKADVYYTLLDHAVGDPETSATRTVAVNRKPPGGLDTNTETAINEGLVPCTVTPSPVSSADSIVTVSVPSWTDQEIGDELTVMWSNARVKQPTLTSLGPQVVSIPKWALQDGGSSDKLKVDYEIRDIVDNYSLVSPATFVRVEIDPEALPAPRVDEADRNSLVLDLEALGDKDGHVTIPAYTGDESRAVFSLEWVGKTPTAEIILTLLPQEIEEPAFEQARFTIPNADLKQLAGGSAVLRYTVLQTSIIRKSKSASITLTGLPVQLAAPVVTEAGGAAVIDLAQIGASVNVVIAAYVGQRAEDRILLSWKGITATGQPVNYADEYVLTTGDVGNNITFAVARENIDSLGGGNLELSYQVVFKATGSAQNSPVTKYDVKAASLAFPAPTIVQAPNGILEPMEALAGATFSVTYSGMQSTDTIVPIWNGISDTIPWIPGDTDETVQSTVPTQLIGAVIGKTIDLQYQVQRAGQGFMSDVLRLKVEAIPQTALPAPLIAQASGGKLDVAALALDADLTVAAWPFIAEGQMMWMALRGSSTEPLASWNGYEINSAGAQATKIPLDYLKKLTDGSLLELVLEVSFDEGVTRQEFPIKTYSVLNKPSVVVPVITSVTTPQGESIANGGSTTSTALTLKGTAGGNTQVSIYDGASALGVVGVNAQELWTYPASGLAISDHSFTAKVAGMEEVVSGPWEVRVIDVPLVIDTSPLALSGHLVRSGRTPTHPPVGTSATRTASGGTPPYTYSVSTNAVDINPTTGTVIAFKNRQGVVTVTDDKGQTAQYTVTVSNVLEIDGWNGTQVYSGAVQNAANYGGRVPTLYEWRDFRTAYGGVPQLPDGANEQAWSSTSAGGKNYYTIAPNNGVEGTQPDQGFIIGGRGAAKGWAIVVRSS